VLETILSHLKRRKKQQQGQQQGQQQRQQQQRFLRIRYPGINVNGVLCGVCASGLP